ncbi:hypothetical protein CAPN007_01720, partial [Capnocytophaga canimorsus]
AYAIRPYGHHRKH